MLFTSRFLVPLHSPCRTAKWLVAGCLLASWLVTCTGSLSATPPTTKASTSAPTSLDQSAAQEIAAANAELERSQFAAAATRLSAAIRIAEQTQPTTETLASLKAKHTRLANLARYYELADYGQQLNFLARDTEAMSVLIESLDQIGLWDSHQWWNELPAEDLNPHQLEALRWDVYRALLTLDGLLVRRMGAALGGMSDQGMAITLSMVRRYVMTDAGVKESKAALEVGQRIEAFQPSQATRWYTATSNFRLRQGMRIKASELGPPENAADAYSLSIMCLIAHMDPTFTTWFSGYSSHAHQADTSPPSNLQTLLDTIAPAAQQAPTHYWTQLTLGHAWYWLGDADLSNGDTTAAIEKFQSARAAFARCIELRPQAPFAYCDRSSVARREAAARQLQTTAGHQPDSTAPTADELLQSSLRDALRGVQLAPEADWVYWHSGLALAATGDNEAAVQAFLTAAEFGMEFNEDSDSLLAKVIDFRGRSEAIQFAKRMADDVDDPAKYLALLGVLEYSRGNVDTAQQTLDTIQQHAQQHETRTASANLLDAWLCLRNDKRDQARASFETALRQAPTNTWGLLGLAQLELASGNAPAALRLCKQVLDTATCLRHQVAGCFAAAQASWRESDYEQAMQYVEQARRRDAACDVNEVIKLAVDDYRSAHAELKHADPAQRVRLQTQIDALKGLLVQLSKLPQASPKRILESAAARAPEPATEP